jgi:molybdopterin-guanine dinucleotide biosynthesis protein B
MAMDRIIAVLGAGRGSGKTTTMEALIKELNRRGYKVGAIKQIHEGEFSIDTPGKDTYRMAQAGAAIVVAAAPREVAAIKKLREEERFHEALTILEGEALDIILVEGNPPVKVPKIFVARNPEAAEKILPRVGEEVICISSYSPEKFRKEEHALQLPFYPLPREIKRLADLVEERLKK